MTRGGYTPPSNGRCREVGGHDWGNGLAVHAPLAEGETQICSLCGASRRIGRGGLRYTPPVATAKAAMRRPRSA